MQCNASYDSKLNLDNMTDSLKQLYVCVGNFVVFYVICPVIFIFNVRFVRIYFLSQPGRQFWDSGGILKWKVRTQTYESPKSASWECY